MMSHFYCVCSYTFAWKLLMWLIWSHLSKLTLRPCLFRIFTMYSNSDILMLHYRNFLDFLMGIKNRSQSGLSVSRLGDEKLADVLQSPKQIPEAVYNLFIPHHFFQSLFQSPEACMRTHCTYSCILKRTQDYCQYIVFFFMTFEPLPAGITYEVLGIGPDHIM